MIGASAVIALVGLGVTLPVTAAQATTFTVTPPGGGGQFTSIQAAVNAAGNGDVINVAAGTYRENVTINGKYITLQGASASSTIIRNPGARAETVFVSNVPFVSGLKTVISGFSIADGNAPGGHGGGMTLYNADAEVSGNVFDSNRADEYGGAVAVLSGSDAQIRGNTFQRNFAGRGGGGVFAAQGSNPTIANNTFTGNSSSGWNIGNGGSSGGAIYLETNGGTILPVVLNNTISSNSADFAGGGIMLRAGAAAVIDGNTIDGNHAEYGAGIHVETAGAQVTISSNTITNNIAASGAYNAGFGGGIAVFDHSKVTINDNTLTGNRASRGGGGITVSEGAIATIKSNTLLSNGAGPHPVSGQYSGGGGIYLGDATSTIYNNVIARSDADQGSAVAVFNSGSASVLNNTIANNTTRLNDGGGAVFFVNAAGAGVGNVSSSVTNNIFSGNNWVQIREESAHAIKRNNLMSLPSGARAGLQPNSDTGTPAQLNSAPNAADNFSGNPAFTNDGANDYSLQRSSAAIDRSTTADAAVYPHDDRRNVMRVSGTNDVGAYEYEASPIQKSPVYRFWSTSKQSHFYTQSKSERDTVASSYSPVEWRYEGVAYDAFSSQIPGTVPLYRFYSETYNGHFYTADENEKNYVRDNYPSNVWRFEGPAYYVYPLDYSGAAQTVWRFWSPDNRHHFYTASDYERDFIQRTYPTHTWTYENGNFKVPLL